MRAILNAKAAWYFVVVDVDVVVFLNSYSSWLTSRMR